MTKFVPKEIKENVNVVKDDPLKVFFKALAGLIIILFMSFVILIGISEIAINYLPARINHSLGKVYQNHIKTPDHLQTDREGIQKLLDAMIENAELKHLNFQVEIMENEIKNAMALPGGYILFTSTLLAELETEHEVAFILGHELAHYQNNDHLRSLSRSVIIGALFGAVSVAGVGQAGNIAASSLNIFGMKYSREQEQSADEFGMEIVYQYYQHASGATSALERIYQEGEVLKTMDGFLSTHPITSHRIKHLANLIERKQYPILKKDALIPFHFEPSKDPKIEHNVISEAVD